MSWREQEALEFGGPWILGSCLLLLPLSPSGSLDLAPRTPTVGTHDSCGGRGRAGRGGWLQLRGDR